MIPSHITRNPAGLGAHRQGVGQAAQGNDRACWWRRWRKREGSDYFWPWRTQLAQAPARVGQSSRPPAPCPFPVPWRGRGEAPVGGPWGRCGAVDPPPDLLPPQFSRVSALACDPTPGLLVAAQASHAASPSPRAPPGMDSGRDFLTLHGECPVCRGDPRERLSLAGRQKQQLLQLHLHRLRNQLLGPLTGSGKRGPADLGRFQTSPQIWPKRSESSADFSPGLPLILLIKGWVPRSSWHPKG